jgi:hypothetical protein
MLLAVTSSPKLLPLGWLCGPNQMNMLAATTPTTMAAVMAMPFALANSV